MTVDLNPKVLKNHYLRSASYSAIGFHLYSADKYVINGGLGNARNSSVTGY